MICRERTDGTSPKPWLGVIAYKVLVDRETEFTSVDTRVFLESMELIPVGKHQLSLVA